MTNQINSQNDSQHTPSLTEREIEKRFGFHKATIEGPNATAPMHSDLRENFKAFASWLSAQIPSGREAALAFTALEEASMWSHKAIAQLAPLEGETE